MNKILYNTTETITESVETLEIHHPTTSLNIKGDVTIQEIKIPQEPFHTTWILDKNAQLTIHTVLNLANRNGTIEIISTDSTSLSLNLGIVSKQENHLNIINKLQKDHNHSEIKVRVVGEDQSHIILKTTGIITKETKENFFSEDIKYLNEEDHYIECIPELLIDSNDVEATHNVTIGYISLEELFYLKSKGISEEEAKKLIRLCFINQMKEK